MSAWLVKIADKAIWPVTIGIVTFIGNLYKRQKAMEDINKSIARKDIIGIYEKARDRGYTTLYEHEAMVKLLQSYYRLGGNGTIPSVEEMYRKIPIETNPLDSELNARK